MQVEIKNKLNEKELFSIKRMKEVIKTTNPHGHKDYLEIVYLEQGAGFHQIDFNRFDVRPHSLYLIMPGQIHSWELTEIPKGFVAMVQKDFLLDHPLYRLLFQTFPAHFPNRFNLESGNETFQSIFASIEQEYLKGDVISEAVIQTYLQLLFHLLGREIKSQPSVPFPPLLHNFLTLLEAEYKFNHATQFYANALNTTSKTLNAVCKRFLGMTVSSIINEKLTAESKKLLLYSHQHLAELAFALGFTDASHFNKFFKRQTGVLPGIYRKGIS
ncbi:MAG TPA: helix-turn-helix transcriptional regulator [Dyadobacter sp.]|jgi:AraC-like DNA-binding protein|nr:helix-turn-helix transcriptional regulator [Dyadobacter sp.]